MTNIVKCERCGKKMQRIFNTWYQMWMWSCSCKKEKT